MEDWRTSLLLSDLQAACNALGGWEDNTYVKEPDCLESLKDLLRYLRRDDESFAIRRALGQINVLKSDLLPILRFYHNEQELFDIVTKLIVNLTTPVVLLYKEELPIERNARNIYMLLEEMLCKYKNAFLEKEIWSALAERLEQLMNLNYHERTDDDTDTITRILSILRNVLHPVNREELKIRTDGDVSSHDRLLWALHLAGMDDLVIYMCAARKEQSHTLYLLEILRLILREQDAEALSNVGAVRSKEELQKEDSELAKLSEVERRKRRLQFQDVARNRFSRFASTYQVTNIKGLDKEPQNLIVVGNSATVLKSINNLDLDQKKKYRARAKNRRPEETVALKRKSTYNIRLFLKEFCSDLLSTAFNTISSQIRKALGRDGDTGDEGQYFWFLDFFLEFNRRTGFDISLVSEAISKETFHFVQTHMEKYHEMMVTDRRRIHLWMKRLTVALTAFQQLVKTVYAMGRHSDPLIRSAARTFQNHLFHLPEYRDIVLHLLLNFNENVAPIRYLRELAVTIHIYLKMLETFSNGGSLKVRTLKSKPKPLNNVPPILCLTSSELDSKWLEVSQALPEILDTADMQLDSSFQTVLEGFEHYDRDFQLQLCKSKVSDLLRHGNVSEAVGLLRDCRKHFSGEACFGCEDLSLEDEFVITKNFFYAENLEQSQNSEADDHEALTSDEERMQDFNFEDFIKRFANPKIIKAYTLLLSHYASNSSDVNLMCIKMLHRIAFDLKMSAMLFQAQLFVIFDKILQDFKIAPSNSDLKELARFSKFIVQQFVDVARTNELALVELLFWKTSAEAYQIQYGYNETEKKKSTAWSELEESELRRLFEECQSRSAPGQDIIGSIQGEFSNRHRSRRQIIAHLKRLGLVDRNTRFKKPALSSYQPWGADEEQELQELHQRFAGSIDPLNQIMLNMMVKRPKFRVIEKLLELGCIHDRSEVQKKKTKKGRTVVSTLDRESYHSDDTIPTEESDADESSQVVSTELDVAQANIILPAQRAQRQSQDHSPKRRKKRASQKISTTKQTTEKIVHVAQLKELLDSVVSNRKAAVNWIMESLQDAMDDPIDSDCEPVPLVPLLEPEHESLRDHDFCKLLSVFGFVPPQDGVEQYWRIGRNLTHSMIASRLDALKRAVESNFDGNLLMSADGSMEEVESTADPQIENLGLDVDYENEHSVSVAESQAFEHDLVHRTRSTENAETEHAESPKGRQSNGSCVNVDPNNEFGVSENDEELVGGSAYSTDEFYSGSMDQEITDKLPSSRSSSGETVDASRYSDQVVESSIKATKKRRLVIESDSEEDGSK